MADTKISALTELAAVPATTDELVIVDKSDTTMAASGTDKRITQANLFADAEFAFSTYKTVRYGIASIGSALVAGTYAVLLGGGAQPLFTANSGASRFYFNPADWGAVGSRTTKLRVLADCATNATAPAITMTIGLYPVTAGGGASGTCTMVAGTVTSGSTVAFVTPGATALSNGNSGDFTCPAAGYYAFGIVTSGTSATNSTTSLNMALQMRQV